MKAGVLHVLWLHGRFKADETCRDICVLNVVLNQNRENQQRLIEFLRTAEADETIAVVLARYGSRSEK